MTRGFLLPLLAALLPLGAPAAGSAQQPATDGTAPGGSGRLCFRDSSLDLLEGEAVQLTAGVHGVRLEISGPAGRFTYSENEMFAEPRTAGEPVSVRAGLRVARHRRQGATGYLFHGRIAAYRDGKTRPVVWVGGEALAGGPADLAILARVRTGPPDGCTERYDRGVEGVRLGQNAQ